MCRLTIIQNSSIPSPALIQLLANMVGILGIQSPSDDESSASMAGLLGKFGSTHHLAQDVLLTRSVSDITSDNLLTCFKILDGYAILCTLKPEFFLEVCSSG